MVLVVVQQVRNDFNLSHLGGREGGGKVVAARLGGFPGFSLLLIIPGELGIQVSILLVDIAGRRAGHATHAMDDVEALPAYLDCLTVAVAVVEVGGQVAVVCGQVCQFAHVVAAFQQVDGTVHVLQGFVPALHARCISVRW